MASESEKELQTLFQGQARRYDCLNNSQKENEGPSVCSILFLQLFLSCNKFFSGLIGKHQLPNGFLSFHSFSREQKGLRFET